MDSHFTDEDRRHRSKDYAECWCRCCGFLKFLALAPMTHYVSPSHSPSHSSQLLDPLACLCCLSRDLDHLNGFCQKARDLFKTTGLKSETFAEEAVFRPTAPISLQVPSQNPEMEGEIHPFCLVRAPQFLTSCLSSQGTGVVNSRSAQSPVPAVAAVKVNGDGS